MALVKPMRNRFLMGPVILLALAGLGAPAPAAPAPAIETGFHLLYEIRFEEARSQFLAWEEAHPEDPLGHAWEAASYLFEEFYHHDVLTSDFFLDDKRFLGGVEGKPNDKYRKAFLDAERVAQDLAKRRLKANPTDAKALLALTLTTGMLADYDSLIEKRQFESLKLIREAQAYAKHLLAVKPDSADAYLALGSANYIIGSLPVHKRFLLWLGGIRGDRQLGMSQLEIAALQGTYLRPFAKILLALIALREKQLPLARTQFEELAAEFPGNPLFARELARLDKSAVSASATRDGQPM